ncbi:hypothetical protein ACTM8Z_01590 [Atopobiaceae bacterium HCP3S3_D6]
MFPSRESLIRMLGDVLAEMYEGWASHRWFTEAFIALTTEHTGIRAPAPEYSGTVEEHSRRIMGLAMADNPTGRRAASWVRMQDGF